MYASTSALIHASLHSHLEWGQAETARRNYERPRFNEASYLDCVCLRGKYGLYYRGEHYFCEAWIAEWSIHHSHQLLHLPRSPAISIASSSQPRSIPSTVNHYEYDSDVTDMELELLDEELAAHSWNS
jgi:hypothetical protein